MLHHGIILILPTVKITLAKVTYRIIRARRRGLVEKSGAGKLGLVNIRAREYQNNIAYVGRSRTFVRPFQSLRASCIRIPFFRSWMRRIERSKARRVTLH